MIPSPARSVVVLRQDEFTATQGQTQFILQRIPISTNSVTLIVNGVSYDDIADFTVDGPNRTVTWTDSLFTMSAGDKVHIRYT